MRPTSSSGGKQVKIIWETVFEKKKLIGENLQLLQSDKATREARMFQLNLLVDITIMNRNAKLVVLNCCTLNRFSDLYQGFGNLLYTGTLAYRVIFSISSIQIYCFLMTETKSTSVIIVRNSFAGWKSLVSLVCNRELNNIFKWWNMKGRVCNEFNR